MRPYSIFDPSRQIRFREGKVKERTMTEEAQVDYVTISAEIVAAYVANNQLPASEIGGLLASIHDKIRSLASGAVAEPKPEPLVPAVSIKRSVGPDFIICLEDGKKFKSLKRHLRSVYDMTPEEYRTKWGLPADYPMVAPNYAQARSELAKKMGLGQQRRKALKAA